jgi:hypothetical protein
VVLRGADGAKERVEEPCFWAGVALRPVLCKGLTTADVLEERRVSIGGKIGEPRVAAGDCRGCCEDCRDEACMRRLVVLKGATGSDKVSESVGI